MLILMQSIEVNTNQSSEKQKFTVPVFILVKGTLQLDKVYKSYPFWLITYLSSLGYK